MPVAEVALQLFTGAKIPGPPAPPRAKLPALTARVPVALTVALAPFPPLPPNEQLTVDDVLAVVL